jgi:glycine reductase
VAHVCTIVPISLTVGANRIIPAVAIPHPLGDPEKTPAEEKKLRKALVKKALLAMQTPVDEQTVFDE